MKEAAGEANMTVITIVLIAIVLGVGLIIVPRMMNKTSERACCTNSGGVWYNDTCVDARYCTNSGSTQTCEEGHTITAECS